MNPIPAKTLHDLQWNAILEALASRAKTDLGKARCLARPFLPGPAEVREELDKTEELRTLWIQEHLTLPLYGVRDIKNLLARSSKGGALEPADLLACANVLNATVRARDFLEDRQRAMPRAWAIASRIADLAKLAQKVERSFEPDGKISDRASPALFDLRERARGLHGSIKTKLDSMLHDLEFGKLLRENYFTIRNERYVVPVLASARSQVPGIVHNASQSGQTLFVEPQPLVNLGNELAIAQSMVTEEERRILQALTEELGEHAIEIEESLDACCELDAIESAAKLAVDILAEPATLVPAEVPFRILALRHPLLALQQKTVIPNDVAFTEKERVLVVSGPNAGGKTVTLSGVGLCSLMLRAGLFIPAERGSTLPLFNDVHSAIGDAQDLSKDLSTFSAHLTTLKEIGKSAGPGSLVLIDEIAADTDPREGAAIALAVLEDLVGKGARCLVTTHLEELKAVAVTDPQYVNARVGFDATKMAPTYKLHVGTPGSSSAIEIARRVGLDPKICDKAEENLKTSAGPLGRALQALEAKEHEADQTRIGLDGDRKAIAEERAAVAKERAALKDRERAIQAEARAELVAEIEKVRGEVAKVLADLQAKPTVRGAVDAQAELAKVAEAEQRKLDRMDAEAKAKAEERMPEGSAIHAGMRVRVPNLGDAQVLEVDGDEAVVTAGALKVRRKLKDLVPLKGQAKAAKFAEKKGEKLKRAEESAPQAMSFEGNRLDVRGMRAEDALRAAETFLDRSYGEGKPGAVILHGHGTGALKATLREYLKGSPYIKSFRPGANHEGGDGITVVEFKG